MSGDVMLRQITTEITLPFCTFNCFINTTKMRRFGGFILSYAAASSVSFELAVLMEASPPAATRGFQCDSDQRLPSESRAGGLLRGSVWVCWPWKRPSPPQSSITSVLVSYRFFKKNFFASPTMKKHYIKCKYRIVVYPPHTHTRTL